MGHPHPLSPFSVRWLALLLVPNINRFDSSSNTINLNAWGMYVCLIFKTKGAQEAFLRIQNLLLLNLHFGFFVLCFICIFCFAFCPSLYFDPAVLFLLLVKSNSHTENQIFGFVNYTKGGEGDMFRPIVFFCFFFETFLSLKPFLD